MCCSRCLRTPRCAAVSCARLSLWAPSHELAANGHSASIVSSPTTVSRPCSLWVVLSLAIGGGLLTSSASAEPVGDLDIELQAGVTCLDAGKLHERVAERVDQVVRRSGLH